MEDIDFRKKNYKVIENFLEKDFVEFIQDYFALKINSSDVNQYGSNYDFKYDPLSEVILQNSCEQLGEIIRINILPTYSFVRMYMKGDQFRYNSNFPSCEISAVLSLGFSNDIESSLIYLNSFSNKSKSVKINLNSGDLCIYRNDSFSLGSYSVVNKWNLQCFLHFVEQTGLNKNLIYDGRPYLGFNSNKDINNEEFK